MYLDKYQIMILADQATSLPQLMQLLRENGSDGVFDSWAIRYFMDVRARQRGIPLNGRFEITPFCNLDCKMCYVHMTKDQLCGKSPLPAETWEAIMQEAIEAGMLYAALTGGECLASPDFERLYLFLHSKGIQVAILTNGVLLDEERICFFKAHPPSCIYVTLYGECEETYERVTGHRQYERVMRNLRMANEALLPIRISITPNRYLGDSVEALLQCAASTGFAFDVGSSLFSPREETGRDDGFRDLDVEDYVRIFKMEQSIKGYQPPVECEKDPPAPNGNCHGEAPRGLRCGAARSTFTVTWDGTIMPCNRLLHLGVHYEKGGLKDTWKQLNQHVLNYLLPRECETCNHRYAARTCAAAHQGEAGHADPEQCKWCQAMVKAGFAQLAD